MKTLTYRKDVIAPRIAIGQYMKSTFECMQVQ